VAGVRDELLALADLDGLLVRARHEAEHPASLVALRDLDAELAGLRTAKRELDVTLVPLATRAKELERAAASARERAGVIGRRLSQSTGAGRELEAMAHERDALVARASALEDEQLELLEQLEPLEAQDAALRSTFADASSRRDAAASEADAERAAAAATLEALEARRPALAEALDPAVLARYEAAARRAGGVGAARLEDGRCGRCRVTVPAALVDQLLHAADPDAFVICDECGRLLVR
jgi:uncharacterized protein